MLTTRLPILLLLLPSVSFAQTQLCQCTGQSKGYIYSGGDQKPLTWYSLQRQQQKETPQSDSIYCYERSVTNHQDRDVTDVDWEVAGYYRDLIPKKSPICESVPVLGGLEHPDPQGPLHYDVSTQAYPTTVYRPVKGWLPKAATLVARTAAPPDLISSIPVALRAQDQNPRVSTLRLRSGVKHVGDDLFFDFEIINMGQATLRVFWNIPMTNDFRPLELNPQAPPLIHPNQTWIRSVRSRDPLGWAVTAVSVYGDSGKIIARGLASVYCSANGEVSFEEAKQVLSQ